MSSFKTSSEIFASPFGPPTALELRQLRQCLDDRGDRKLLLQLGDRRLRRADSHDAASARCRAYVLARFTLPRQPGAVLPDARRAHLPDLPGDRAVVLRAAGIGLLNTLPGLILTYAAFAFPFTVFFLYAFFRSLSRSIAEAAAVDGAGEWRTFFQIMLPMAKPGLATVAILNFVGLWNQFLLPIALNTNPDNYVLTQAHGVLRVPGRLLGGLRRALRGRGDHRRTGADHLPGLPAWRLRIVSRPCSQVRRRDRPPASWPS